MTIVGWLMLMAAGITAIVWGAELFAEHLAATSARLGISTFGLALLLAGAEPEELATVITASARDVDGVAFGDVIGANAAIVTLALGVGALTARALGLGALTARALGVGSPTARALGVGSPTDGALDVATLAGSLPFGPRIRRYGIGGLAAAAIAGPFLWDGSVGRIEGSVLVAVYVVFVAAIWRAERQPPALGEVAELDEHPSAQGQADRGHPNLRHTGEGLVGRELILVLVGLAALTIGSIALVEAVRRLSGVEATQTRLGLTIVGFATAFELVALAWSASRRGIADTAVAGVVGSYAYNLTMSLGAGAIIAPIEVSDVGVLRPPFMAMAALLAVALALSKRGDCLNRRSGWVLISGYPVFVAIVLAT